MRFRKRRIRHRTNPRSTCRHPRDGNSTYFWNTCRVRRGNDKSNFVADLDAFGWYVASSGRLDRLDSRENDALAVDGKTRAAVSATRPHRFHSAVLNLLLIPVVNNIERCSYNGVRAYAYTRGPSGRTNERTNERTSGSARSGNSVLE